MVKRKWWRQETKQMKDTGKKIKNKEEGREYWKTKSEGMQERGGKQDEGEQHERFCLWQLDRHWKMLVPLYTRVEDRRTVPVSNVLICFKTIWHVESPSRSTCPGLLLFCCLCAWHCTVYVLSVSLNHFISLIRYFIYLTQPPQGMWSHPPVFLVSSHYSGPMGHKYTESTSCACNNSSLIKFRGRNEQAEVVHLYWTSLYQQL